MYFAVAMLPSRRIWQSDQRIETVCRKYYKSSSGRPSITPGTYFRMMLLGFFEGIESERGIAWRAADSLSVRQFLNYDLQRSDAGSLDGLAHPAAVFGADASGGDAVGAEDSAQARAGAKDRASASTRRRWKPMRR